MVDRSLACVVCNRGPLETELQLARRTCDSCATKTGNIVLPPPRRRVAPCVKCNHAKIVRCVPRELSVVEELSQNVPSYGPMFAAYELRFRYDKVQPIHARSGFGVLEAYICRKCGFVEWYCQNAEEIPIGPEYMTEELDADGDTPYR